MVLEVQERIGPCVGAGTCASRDLWVGVVRFHGWSLHTLLPCAPAVELVAPGARAWLQGDALTVLLVKVASLQAGATPKRWRRE